jgi:hypothetical protein
MSEYDYFQITGSTGTCWKPLCSFINDIPTGSKHTVQGSSKKQID